MSQKCDACGSTDIDVDPSRADAVCTNCGKVLESSIIVSDIQFEENAHGGSSAIGTFVSSESKGGGGSRGLGGTFQTGGCGGGIGRESREITLRNARKKIEALAQQLSLRRDRIDMAFHFFKLALSRGLTRGRKSTHVIAACVYITCRTEGTSHMLIDFSDILQIDVYELGRTYLRLSQALCINIPAMDPCLYVMRFAHKLEFGDKTHEVSMTALRLVSRMKKDWIHFGRRPSGLCGAALLIASRLHMFHRSVLDVIKVVKVHESTLRKRLNEFGETPASQLTLEEFMNIDLDAMTEEMDPPSFKIARKKDKERLMKLEEEEDLDVELTKLEREIEKQLEERSRNKKSSSNFPKLTDNPSKNREEQDAEQFIAEQTLESISELVNVPTTTVAAAKSIDRILMPPPNPDNQVVCSPGMGLKATIQEYLIETSTICQKKEKDGKAEDSEDEELDLTGINDEEIDGYLMSDNEIKYKTELWMKVNAEYLKEKVEKEERERKEAEEAEKEGREPPKKRKKQQKKPKVNLGANATALEAIEKIVQEKKISTKINYEVLKSLNMGFDSKEQQQKPESPQVSKVAAANADSTSIFGEPVIQTRAGISSIFAPGGGSPLKRPIEDQKISDKQSKKELLRFRKDSGDTREVIVESGPVVTEEQVVEEPVVEGEEEEDFDDENLSVAQLLSKHRGEADELESDEFEEDFY